MDKIGTLYPALLLCAVILMFYRQHKHPPEDDEDDFTYLTVREQIAIANQTAEEIATAEQLITDMQESTQDDVMVLHIEWIGRDAQRHEMDLHCSGEDTATECIIQIAEREVHELKNALAHQCAVLSEEGRSRQHRRQNAAAQEGEGSVDEAVYGLRSRYLNG